jgi:hypothetical protein
MTWAVWSQGRGEGGEIRNNESPRLLPRPQKESCHSERQRGISCGLVQVVFYELVLTSVFILVVISSEASCF